MITHAPGVVLNSIEPKTGAWNLSDLGSASDLTVFSCFHCGGGSTMGYKLAGFDVLGGVEIDPKMMAIYRKNHRPKHSYLMGVQEFNQIDLADYPDELKNLDILDGSPPCSVFSLSGSRDKKWGDEHNFAEGNAKQRQDDLFFHFIETAARLQPKVVVAENVEGLIRGKARGYVKEIFAAFTAAGYRPQLFLLNSSRMGVPQSRSRTFFVASRKDLDFPKIRLEFNEETISLRDALVGTSSSGAKPLTPKCEQLWRMTKRGHSFKEVANGSYFNESRLAWDRPAFTQTATKQGCHPDEPRRMSPSEVVRIQTFPDDYDFGTANAGYVCGMSVPPFMTQRIALAIRNQWLAA